jgi:hypothetical protein
MSDVVGMRYRLGDDGQERLVRGRYAWTLWQLYQAGERGITPIERPAPRWSHYVDILRDREGLDIETVEERHGGPFKGTHGRYVLHSLIDVVEVVRQ